MKIQNETRKKMSNAQNARWKKLVEENRKKIIFAAEKLFYAKEYSKTNIADILHLAKLSKSTYYNYFKSKQELFLEICMLSMKTLADVLEKFQKQGNFAVIGLKNAIFFFIKEHPYYSELINDKSNKIILAKIYAKQAAKEKLTPAEIQFRTHKERIASILQTTVEVKFEQLKIDYTEEMVDGVVGALSTMFSGFSSEYVYRRDILKQHDSIIERHLDNAFKIIDRGLNLYSA